MVKPPDLVDDTTLHGLLEASCCTACARHLVAGDGNQLVDAQGRLHRHCARCHAELMTPDPKPLSSQLGKSADPGPTSAGAGPDLPLVSPLPGLSLGHGSEDGRPVARPGGSFAEKEHA